MKWGFTRPNLYFQGGKSCLKNTDLEMNNDPLTRS